MAASDPYDLASIPDALAGQERSVAEFFGSLTPDESILRVGDAWTPAEHLAHLSTAVSAVARGFGIPRWILGLRFGRNRRGASRTFAALRDDYLALLARGGGARGRFIPPREEMPKDQAAARRAELLARWHRVNQRMRLALQGWSDADLDRVRLPHPLLGTITAREMLFFLIYHGGHHVEAARRRLPRFSQGLAPERP